MSNHVTQWLNAYLDGELHGIHLQHVEAHLVDCKICRTELEGLETLSGLLQEVAVPEFIPPERLAAQVSLRLPPSKPVVTAGKALEVGWWMIPVGLFASWIFINASFLINDLLSMANNFGFSISVSDWIRVDTPGAANWSTALAQIGVLSGNALDVAAYTESLTRSSLWQIGLQISIALLYLSWIAIWWARHQRQENDQIFVG